jgi:hypothetical protein
MSLEGLLKELDKTRRDEQERMIASIREQNEALIRAKDEEISVLKEEIATLRCWLDHSALPAHNPISKRKDSMGLIKMNFGKDKPCPDMWSPGEKDMLDSIPSNKEPESEWPEPPKLEESSQSEPGPIDPMPDPPIPEPNEEALPVSPKPKKPRKTKKTKKKRK